MPPDIRSNVDKVACHEDQNVVLGLIADTSYAQSCDYAEK